jgi:2-polyprenyl-3-methyl-5-hydroxy-6-metoxy-1,4-benzoquinol methylase
MKTDKVEKGRAQLISFLKDCEIHDFTNKKLLEIGFRNGNFMNECVKAGLTTTGIDINREYYEAAKTRFPFLDIKWYDGSVFPVPADSFDYVVSFQVLEHVSSIEHILTECIRVLKPGGIMYHVCPNYRSFYEGHFKVIWLPFLNKTLGRIYLKLLRRYKDSYELLNLVNPKFLSKLLKEKHEFLTVLSLGHREFAANFNKDQIAKVKQPVLRAGLRAVSVAPLLRPLFIWIALRANFYYPIKIISRKRRSSEREPSEFSAE